jgi:hypothetical protein
MEVDAQTIRDSVEAKLASERASTDAAEARLAAAGAMESAQAANDRSSRLEEDMSVLAEVLTEHERDLAEPEEEPTTAVGDREPDPTDPPPESDEQPAPAPAPIQTPGPPAAPPAAKKTGGLVW